MRRVLATLAVVGALLFSAGSAWADYRSWYYAEQGDAEAQMELGLMHLMGVDVLKNNATAIKWFRKAAEQDDTRAQAEYLFV